MSRKFTASIFIAGACLVAGGCESSQQKEAKRINQLNVENCLMKKEDTVYCDRVNPELTSEEVMKQVKEQKGIIVKDLEEKKNVEKCLDNSMIDSCKRVDSSYVSFKTLNAVIEKIQYIKIDKCVNDKELNYCKEIDLSSTDKETEASVINTTKALEAKQKEEAAMKKAEEFKQIIVDHQSNIKGAASKIISGLDEGYQPAKDYLLTLEKRWMNGDKDAVAKLAGMANLGSKHAREVLDRGNAIKDAAKAKQSRKSKQAALREICEAGAEYSRDGYGTQQQIAHELAYWVIDLYKQTGGAASEGQLKNAGAHGYLYENCSKY